MTRKVLVLFGLLTVGAACLARSPLLTGAGRFLIVDDPPEPADAIVVLAGSMTDRVLEGAALYQSGFAPRILLSRDPEPGALIEARAMGLLVPSLYELNRWTAEQLGVPEQAIVGIGGRDDSTLTEARTIVRYLLEHGYGRVLLVTSKMHTRRAALIYRYLAAGRVHFIMRPSRYDRFEPDRWWRNRTFTRRVVIEYEKLLVFFLIDRWRIGPPVDRVTG